MYGSDGPGGGSGGPGGGSTASSTTASSTTASCHFKSPLLLGRGGALLSATGVGWDNYKGLPMLELWTARTRNLGEPQVPD